MKKENKKSRFTLVTERIWLLLMLLWVLLIFGHSLTPAELSSKESGWVMDVVLKMLNAVGNDGRWLTGYLVRKSAHFLEYAVFGLLLIQNFRCVWKSSEWNIEQPHRGKMEKFIPVAFIVFTVPFCDETLQLFTPGRAGMLEDVWLDISGAVCGIFLRETLSSMGIRLIQRRRPHLRQSRW